MHKSRIRNNELDMIYSLSKELISPKICFIKKLGKDVFQAYEHSANKKQKTVYFLKLNENKLDVFNTMKFEM